MNIKPWQEFDKVADLYSEKIQIWLAFFDREDCSSYFHLLSEDEKARAARLMDLGTASRQIISRGILRLLIGRYSGMDPKQLSFNCSEFGKPFLTNPADSGICFNLSHSGSLLLIAVVSGKQVGIDVEKNESKIDVSGIASIAFSAEEQSFLSRSIDPVHDFYELWTAKEAILKSTGLGFSYPSNKFSVAISKGKVQEQKITNDLPAGTDLSLISFSPVEGYSAAVAAMR